MPQCETHLACAAVGSAILTTYGFYNFGWTGCVPVLAFIAGTAGGLVPDLDSDHSKPLRMTGVLVGSAAAAAVSAFLLSKSGFLNRPWPLHYVFLSFICVFLLFNFLAIKAFRRFTRHRGLFHSLAVPFLYGGIWACLVTPYAPQAAMAVWMLGVFGVFSHLFLDACKSLSINPLKLATRNIQQSSFLWLVTTAVTLSAFVRLTKF